MAQPQKKTNFIRLPGIVARSSKSTDALQFYHEIRMEMHEHDISDLAEATGRTVSCMYAFRRGATKWPRHTTLFPLLEALGYEVQLVKVK